MSEVTFFLVRIAYLAVLWILVLSAISVIRSDMFGTKDAAAQAPARTKPRRGLPTTLTLTEGPNQGSHLPLADVDVILIGRGDDAAVRVDDDYVSTRHARIVRAGDQWVVEDLGSTNGTYVNGVRISEPTQLSIGLAVRVGKTVMELRK